MHLIKNPNIPLHFMCQGIPHLVILDGDDATLITLEGTNAVVKDQYGLEYPWRARSLMNMMPKPLKRLLKSKINQVVRISQGMIEGIAPRRVLSWMKVQAINLLTAAKEQFVAFIKEKAAKKNRPAAEVGVADDSSKSKSSQDSQVGALSVSGSESDEDSEL
jgi:hypothetical protein